MKKILIVLSLLLLIFTSCSLSEKASTLGNSGTSNTTPLYVSYPSVIISVNQTDVTGWTGLLANDQHVLDNEVIAAVQAQALELYTGTLVNGNFKIQGASGGFQLAPRDGSGTTFTYYNPTGDDWKIYDTGDRFSVISGAGIKIYNGYIELDERSAPGSAGTDNVRIYAIQGGDTLTDLNAVFQDGTVVTFAEESTPLDSPIFRYPSGTEIKYKMIKPNPAIIQFVAEFSDGSQFVLKTIEYHNQEKINASKGADNPLPNDWIIEKLDLLNSSNMTGSK